jgi:DNA-binding transcriptional LysR family regulator
MDLAGINLNLLLALHALLEEGGVGRAAARVGVTQAAMSHQLRQLRELLGDPLLVREGQRMVPTPRAEAIAPALRAALVALENVVREPEAFDPFTADGRFTVALHDGTTRLLGGGLIEAFRAEAPRASLSIVPPADDLPEALATRRIDLAIVPPIGEPSGVCAEPVFPTEWAVLFREDLPGVGDTIDLDTYCRLPHALMSLTGHGPGLVDHLLRKLGRERFIALRAPYLLALPELLASSDLLATVPRGAAQVFARAAPLRWVEPPIEIPGPPMLLIWHARFDAAPANRWLRELIHRFAAAAPGS